MKEMLYCIKTPAASALVLRRGHIGFCLFVCLGVIATIIGEGLQILTYSRQSWPLSNEGS